MNNTPTTSHSQGAHPGTSSSTSVAARVAEIMKRISVVARLYQSGRPGGRRYRRASVQSGPGEPLVQQSVVEGEIRRLIGDVAQGAAHTAPIGVVKREPQLGHPERRIAEVPDDTPIGSHVYATPISPDTELAAMKAERDAVLAAARHAGWNFIRHSDGVVRLVPLILGEAQATKAVPLERRDTMPDGWYLRMVQGGDIHIVRDDGSWCGYSAGNPAPAHRMTYEYLCALFEMRWKNALPSKSAQFRTAATANPPPCTEPQ